MKAKRILIGMLCAAIMLTLIPPVNAYAADYTYAYGGLTFSSDAPLDGYLSFNYNEVTLYPLPDMGRHYLTISGSSNNLRINIRGNADITLDNVTMSGQYYAIALEANVSLYLKGSNTFIVTGESPALIVDYGAHVSIRPDPDNAPCFLYAKGGSVNPGINVGRSKWDSDNYGMLEIWGGTVTAVSGAQGAGGTGGAGIGGRNNESGGNITIHDGFVTAIGAKAAGIGSGNESEAGSKIGGKISILGGTVIAVGGNQGAGIGGGDDDSDGGEITISGGFVTAIGGAYAAGIGGGNNGTSGSIEIRGGTVIAAGGVGGAGIGGGKHNNEDGGFVNSIQIYDGVIFARGNDGAQDIGMGDITEGTPVDLENMTGAAAVHADINDPNPPAVFLRNNTVFGNNSDKIWIWIDGVGYSRVGPMNYGNISKYGIELGSLIPGSADIPAISGTLPDGVTQLNADWIRNLWTEQLNHWLNASRAGAYLKLKSINYYQRHDSSTPAHIKSQHFGTTGQISGGSVVSRTGYTFDGWETSPGVPYTSNGYTFNNDLNLYAAWTPNSYTVSYDPNGGAGSMDDTNHTYDVAADLPENTFTRTGYNFAGWAAEPTGDVEYSDKQSVINLAESGTVTLYAVWTPIQYPITYLLDGGIADPANPDSYDVEDLPLTLVNPTKPGFDFVGWSATGSTDEPVVDLVIPEGTIGGLSFTAHWTPGYSLRTLTDSATGISVYGMIRNDAELTVNDMELGDDAACDAIRERMNGGEYVLVLGKDISLTQGFKDTLTITVPVGAKYNGQTITILHCADGTLNTYTAKAADGKAVFSVEALSPFAVFAKEEIDDIPKTGDESSPLIWWLLCGVSAAGIITVCLLGRRKQAHRR